MLIKGSIVHEEFDDATMDAYLAAAGQRARRYGLSAHDLVDHTLEAELLADVLLAKDEGRFPELVAV